MLEAQEDVFYYVTVTNENYAHPALPPHTEEGILRGMYLLRAVDAAKAQILASGPMLRQALLAADQLQRDGIPVTVWSVTSWTELRWDGIRKSRENREQPWITASLGATDGPIFGVSDYVSALPDLVRPWIPVGKKFVALGTDGFGMSDTRAALRDYFGVSANAIAERVRSEIL